MTTEKTRHFSAVSAELEAHLNPDSGIDKSWRRNASLAWVKFHFDAPIPFSNIPGSLKNSQVTDRCQVILKYLQEYGDASIAYNDLRPYVERLDMDERVHLLERLNKNERSEVQDTASRGNEDWRPFGETVSGPIMLDDDLTRR